jgi:glycine oxidase
MAVDCLVIGGGVIGLTTAWKLAQQGFSVRVCDQSTPGREASWAGAGILPPGHPGPMSSTALAAVSSPASDPLTQLTSATCALWPKLSAELLEITGLDNEFHRCGGVELSLGTREELLASQSQWEAIGVRTEWLDPVSVRALEPACTDREPAFLLPDLCQVRNPRHLAALLRACQLAGVEITPDCPVTGWTSKPGRLTAAVTPHGEITAGKFCVTAGAWSSQLLATAGMPLEVIPVRGQIVLLEPSTVRLTRVIERDKRYLVPRRDGHILIGSTEELTGFEKINTDEGIRGLLEFAFTICPTLREAHIKRCWSGLRPCAVRGRPYIGPVPGWENLLVATGHFRSGLHLSPATAEILVSLIQGQSPHPEWAAFGVPCPGS